MIDLTDEIKVLDLLDRAVSEKGADYTYETPDSEVTCVYFTSDGKPSCIVGHVLAYEGMTLTDIGGFNAAGSHELSWERFIKTNDRTEYLLARVQDNQDSGMPWSEALETAKRDTENEFDC